MIHHTIVVTGESCGAARYRNVSKLTISKHSIFGISYNFNDAMIIQYAIQSITKKNRHEEGWSMQEMNFLIVINPGPRAPPEVFRPVWIL